ncbi:hypothetical protein BJ742DRAFT_737201 [Cladochytrium replicatum]|nr:hypothetical protein BJ742DRAFT_737201 [Cladochytrium replicatum]
MGRTGEELILLDWEFEQYSTDSPESAPVAKFPIVWRMAKKNGPFMKALREFPLAIAAATSVHTPTPRNTKGTAKELQVISVSNFFEKEIDSFESTEIEMRYKSLDGSHPEVPKLFAHHLLFNDHTPKESQKLCYDAIETLPPPGCPRFHRRGSRGVCAGTSRVRSQCDPVRRQVCHASRRHSQRRIQLANLLTSKSKPAATETASSSNSPATKSVPARGETVRRILMRITKDSTRSEREIVLLRPSQSPSTRSTV